MKTSQTDIAAIPRENSFGILFLNFREGENKPGMNLNFHTFSFQS